MSRIALSLLVLSAACVDAPDEVTTDTSVQALKPRCEDWGCGINSPRVDDNFFHELNFDGLINTEGYYLTGAKKGLAIYGLELEGGKLVARVQLGAAGSPTTLRGQDLVGLELKLYMNGSERLIRVASVRNTTFFIASAGPFMPSVETYKFTVSVTTSTGLQLTANLCPLEALNTTTGTIPAHYALLFGGERVDGRTKLLSAASSQWITIGCEGSALAKMHLYGHTATANTVAGFRNTLAERQTFLRAMTADYCGTGKVFTVAGQPLEFWSDDGSIVPTPGVSTTLEARWAPTGAVCLHEPRLAANPPPGELHDLGVPTDVAADVARTCKIPDCGTQRAHIFTFNPN